MELKREEIAVNEVVSRITTQVLVEDDIVLPEIKSDIAKILMIDATSAINDVVCDNGRAQASGRVYLRILYVPDGDVKPVCCVGSVLDFECDIEDRHMTPECKIIACADAKNVEYSMLNSRKVNVKTVVEIESKCMCEKSIPMVVDAVDEGFVETKKKNINVYQNAGSTSNKFTLKDTLDFPAGKPSALSVLKCDVRINDKEIRMVTNKVVIRGSVGICTLYVSSDNTLEYMEHELPFTEVVDADGASEDAVCDLDLWICRTDFGLRVDADGDMRLLDIELLFGANTEIMKTDVISAIEDAYGACRGLHMNRREYSFESLFGQGRTQHSMKEVIEAGELGGDLVSIYNVVAVPQISETRIGDDKVMIDGVLKTNLLYLSNSAASPVSMVSKQFPFSCSIDIDGINETHSCDIKTETAHIGYNITMSGDIELRATVNVTVTAIENVKLALVDDMENDEDNTEMRHGIVIYFVQKGDSIWDIGKRYGVPIALLKDINKLDSDEDLFTGKRMLIPNCRG